MSEAVAVLVGTTKGAFVVTSESGRADWTVHGPFCDGWPINHVIGDASTGRLWAVGGGAWSGAGVWRTDASRAEWSLAKLASGEMDAWVTANPEEAAGYGLSPTEPAPFTGEMDALWSIALCGDHLYAGAKPAMLFRSGDGGATWLKVETLGAHPSRETWEPGAA
ncbi:MAG: hypothetical protein AAFX39_00615 [Pseudomonadota bacterium]